MASFDTALAFVLRWEGGLHLDPDDPGGLTNHGISQQAYPGVDIAALTKERIVELYRKDYWEAARCEEMPAPMALVMFDSAVNQGVGTAVRCLQRAVGVKADGLLGPATMEAAERTWKRAPDLLLRDVCFERLMHYTSLELWKKYRRNWGKRLADVLVHATKMLAR